MLRPPGPDPYNAVTTYQDLIDLNVRFLQGENIETPYHGNHVDPETLPHLTDLIRINKVGFHSTCGQPEYKARDISNTFPPWYTDTCQKSYIRGIITRTMAGRLATFLRNQPTVFFHMYQIDPFRVMINTFPCAKFNITKFRSSEDEIDLERKEWTTYTNIRPQTESVDVILFELAP
jgi:hypothetical protein